MAVSPQLQDLINQQVNNEFYASYLYLSMSTWFDAEDLPGFAHWMRVQSQEEYAHALRLIGYLQDQEARVSLYPIDQPPVEFDSVVDVVRRTLAQEQSVTASINEIYAAAAGALDFATQSMLQWFVAEQVEEEKSVRDVLAALNRVAGHQDALMILDREMAARPPAPAGLENWRV